jgi:hypothetical protein
MNELSSKDKMMLLSILLMSLQNMRADDKGEEHVHDCNACPLSGHCPIESDVRLMKASNDEKGDSHVTPEGKIVH